MSEQAIPFVLERAERDGCGCPPFILRCAHFDDRILVVIHVRQSLCPHASRLNPGFGPYTLSAFMGHWSSCPTCGTYGGIDADQLLDERPFNTLDEANAAFDAAEITLLRGRDA